METPLQARSKRMTTPDPWACTTCHTVYVVTSLARLCEAKHEQETTP